VVPQLGVPPRLGDLRYHDCYHKITEDRLFSLMTRCRDGGIRTHDPLTPRLITVVQRVPSECHPVW
jgi:hypothetical protein